MAVGRPPGPDRGQGFDPPPRRRAQPQPSAGRAPAPPARSAGPPPRRQNPPTQRRVRSEPAPASGRDPTGPTLRAKPCSEVTAPFCRLPSPTLFQRLEAVHLGDLLRIWVRIWATVHCSTGFSRASDGAPDAAGSAALYRNCSPISGRTDSRGSVLNKEERTLPGATTSVSRFECVTALAPLRGRPAPQSSGILTRFPFGSKILGFWIGKSRYIPRVPRGNCPVP